MLVDSGEAPTVFTEAGESLSALRDRDLGTGTGDAANIHVYLHALSILCYLPHKCHCQEFIHNECSNEMLIDLQFFLFKLVKYQSKHSFQSVGLRIEMTANLRNSASSMKLNAWCYSTTKCTGRFLIVESTQTNYQPIQQSNCGIHV